MFSEEDNGVPALVLLHVVGRECMWRKTQTFIYIYIHIQHLHCVLFSSTSTVKHVHISVLKDIVLVTLLTYGPNVVSVLFYCSSHVYYD